MSAVPASRPGPDGPVVESSSVVGSRSTDGWKPGHLSEGLIGPLLLMVGVTMIIVIGARMRARRRQAASTTPRPGEAPGPAGRGREDIERMAVDLEEVARSVSAILDTRMRALDALIRDADRRIASLKELAGGRPEPAGSAEEPADSTEGSAPGGTAAEETLAHHAGICSLADQGLSVQEIAERTGYQRGEVELVLSLRKAAQSGGA